MLKPELLIFMIYDTLVDLGLSVGWGEGAINSGGHLLYDRDRVWEMKWWRSKSFNTIRTITSDHSLVYKK